jgi:hypothetical protein
MQLISTLFRFGPILFGLGFLAPLIAATFHHFDIQPPLGQTPIVAGLIVGVGLGGMAMWRRSWI